jgi:hypothetical protein
VNSHISYFARSARNNHRYVTKAPTRQEKKVTSAKPLTTSLVCWRSTRVPAEDATIALINRLLEKTVTAAVTAMFTSNLNVFDFRRTKSPITAQKVKAGSRKISAEFESMANPVSMLMVESAKVSRMPKIATASTAEASVSGDGFKFIKTRLIDEIAKRHRSQIARRKPHSPRSVRPRQTAQGSQL